MNERVVFHQRFVPAPPEAVFDLLADPSQHSLIDGSGMVRAARGEPNRLALGSKFAMSMRMGPIPYRITNEVVELEEDRRIAWTHIGGHRWRWELEPHEGGTRVTESFDWSTAKLPQAIELVRFHTRNAEAIAATLDRLVAHFSARPPAEYPAA